MIHIQRKFSDNKSTTHFLMLTTPYGMIEIIQTQFLIEFLDQTQKSTASRQKKFPRV